jgi:hypothetical protein
MRGAVNRTVTTVRFAGGHTHPGQDLADAFPDADQLVCDFDEPQNGPPLPTPIPIDHAWLMLERIATASPRFVSKLRVLKMYFHHSHVTQIVELLAELLPRYGRALRSFAMQHACDRQLPCQSTN